MGHADKRIRIAAALIDDGQGRLLLVRKAGTPWFMQPGGKIEDGESAAAALVRELREEIGLQIDQSGLRRLGLFSASAANEADHVVEAEMFHIRVAHMPHVSFEIEEAVWVDRAAAQSLPLALLTREHVLPLWRSTLFNNADADGAATHKDCAPKPQRKRGAEAPLSTLVR